MKIQEKKIIPVGKIIIFLFLSIIALGSILAKYLFNYDPAHLFLFIGSIYLFYLGFSNFTKRNYLKFTYFFTGALLLISFIDKVSGHHLKIIIGEII